MWAMCYDMSVTYFEAEKSSWELVVIALTVLLWAWTSPTSEQLSMFQTLRKPARQPLRRQFEPGMKVSPHTQSLCALLIDWNKRKYHIFMVGLQYIIRQVYQRALRY